MAYSALIAVSKQYTVTELSQTLLSVNTTITEEDIDERCIAKLNTQGEVIRHVVLHTFGSLDFLCCLTDKQLFVYQICNDLSGQADLRISIPSISTEHERMHCCKLKSFGKVGVCLYGKTSLRYLQVDCLQNDWKIDSHKDWGQQAIFGQYGPWPEIKEVQIAESELVYILDTLGRLTILNKDLPVATPAAVPNALQGVIFTIKPDDPNTSGGPFSTFYLTKHPSPPPADSVQTFKRAKNLEPEGLMLTLSTKSVVTLWDTGSQLCRKEGTCLIKEQLRRGFGSIVASEWMGEESVLIVMSEKGMATLLRVRSNEEMMEGGAGVRK